MKKLIVLEYLNIKAFRRFEKFKISKIQSVLLKMSGRCQLASGMGFNPHRPILDQNSWDIKTPEILDPGLMGPIFPIGPRGSLWVLAAIPLGGPIC